MDDVLKLSFLGSLQRSGIVPGLSRMRALVQALGNPQLEYPVIIVTGTNGKGSTTCFIESILRHAGLVTGRFTSPHLVDVRERIFIGGRMIGQDVFDRLGLRLHDVMASNGLDATFFEALSAIGFMAFAEARVDVAVVEVGMGGRLDSTNVAEPVVSVLTNVGLDHVAFLGGTVESIAMEKVGVARNGRHFVTGVDDGLFESTVGPELSLIGARAVRMGRDFRCAASSRGLDWRGWCGNHDGLVSGPAGSYQATNLCLAVAAVECLRESAGFNVTHGAVVDGARNAVWPARFQKVAESPATIIDGCHNVHAAHVLRGELAGLSRPLIMVHGSRPEKDYDGVLRLLAPMVDAVIESWFDGGADPREVARSAAAYVRQGVPVDIEPELAAALARASAMAGPGGTVLLTGSLYMIGSAIAEMGWDVWSPAGKR